MRTTIINHKRYLVNYISNMVGNYYFIDKNGNSYLVDGEDVAVFAGTSSIENAIKYAKHLAKENGGVFWWKIKES